MAINKFKGQSVNRNIGKIPGDAAFARFGDLNRMVTEVTADLKNLTPDSITFSCNTLLPEGWNTIGDWVTFTKEDYASDVDIVIPGVLHIKRDNNKGIYNAALEGIYDDDDYVSPINTEWNSQDVDPTYYGWSDLSTIATRTFNTWVEASDWNPSANVDNQVEFIMRETTTGRYWQVQFLQWTSGNNGGGFSYKRREIIYVTAVCGGITFGDGTQMRSIYDALAFPDDLYTTVGSGFINDGDSTITLPSTFENWKLRVFRNGTLLDTTEYTRAAADNTISLANSAVIEERFAIIAYKKA